ncbi:MAG: protein translocase subunit SecD [Candidatus Omnitrophica bacterium]|nr:protein translocase subunit SecD [Candidatus Omnitrophota bacterium]
MDKKLIVKIGLVLAVIGLCIYYSFPLDKRINLGLDLKGGMHLLLKVDTSNLSGKAKDDAADRAIEVVRNRIDEFGVRETSIAKQGEDEIVVQLPGITDRERALEIIGRTALLEFKLVSQDQEKLKAALDGKVPEGFELKRSEEDSETLLLEAKAVLTGDSLTNAEVHFSSGDFGEPAVGLKFNADGAKKFADLTAANVGRRLAIVLDGKIQSAPRIREAIPSGEAVISGHFDVEQAQDLSVILRVGALPAPMKVEEERTVGPLLGQDSINSGVKAALIGVSLVFLVMIIYYFLAGFISDIALFLNLIMTLGILGMLKDILGSGASVTLTLPGIAGIALSLGMAVDANVLINERIREELAIGRNLRTAIANGYQKAFSAIFDSNLTTLIAAFLLFQFGTGPIRGFAITLTIGLLTSMFTAIVVTRTIFEVLLHFNLIKSLPMLKLFKEPKFDYIGKRKIFYAISVLVIGIGLFSYFSKGKQAFGIDFAGGQLQEYSFKDTVNVEKVRSVLKELNLADASLQQYKDQPKVLLIRTAQDKNTEITAKLKQAFPAEDIQVLKIERVGPVAGKHLQDKAVKALIWSLIGILIYVAFRFKHFNFAIAGVIALLHDVLVAVGGLAITGRQIDLLSVTALLTIAGYSINDTIVIYDRVRENMALQRKMSLAEVINLSVNQCMSRTILTSGVTLLVVFAIFFYGGEILSNFAYTLIVGFISGVYSTVFIASPLILAWSRVRGKK